MVMISLALFLTAFVMAPTLERSYEEGIAPLLAEQIDEQEAFTRTAAPLREFMLRHVRERDLELFLNLSRGGPVAFPAETPPSVLVPAIARKTVEYGKGGAVRV